VFLDKVIHFTETSVPMNKKEPLLTPPNHHSINKIPKFAQISKLMFPISGIYNLYYHNFNSVPYGQ